MFISYLSLLILTLCGLTNGQNSKTFPKDFLFGVSSAAYQIEGAWDADGKGLNMWDYITHNLDFIIEDHSNGDIACDAYNKIDEDIERIKYLGVNIYRFSISWTRVLPTGGINNTNQKGIDHYQYIIDKLLEAGIEPMITLLHNDIPLTYQLNSGFVQESMIEAFENYARLMFQSYGDKVKYWLTFNEPLEQCGPYLQVTDPLYSGTTSYQCAHNIIRAHARAYHVYKKEFSQYNGKISIVLNYDWGEPATYGWRDLEAANRKIQFELGWFAFPLLKGDYPALMKLRVRTGIKSRLPSFTEAEKKSIKGTMDFFALNHYSTALVTDASNETHRFPSFAYDEAIKLSYDSSWGNTSLPNRKVVPWGLRKVLKYIHKEFDGIDIIITENGYCGGDEIQDYDRVNYYKGYLGEVYNAIYKDGVNLKGYCAWSLMDDFEWFLGYSVKYGLYHVDFESPNRTRTPKKSAEYYKKIVETRSLIPEEE